VQRGHDGEDGDEGDEHVGKVGIQHRFSKALIGAIN